MGGAADIRHEQQLDAGLPLQQFAGEMGQAAHARRGVGNAARARLGARDQLRQARDPEPRRDREKHRVLRHEPDRQKILRHVQRNVGRGRMQRHERRQHRLVERVPVGGGVCRRPGGKAAAGAGTIVHNHLLTPELGEPVGDEP